jgi:hypothetical protein
MQAESWATDEAQKIELVFKLDSSTEQKYLHCITMDMWKSSFSSFLEWHRAYSKNKIMRSEDQRFLKGRKAAEEKLRYNKQRTGVHDNGW